MALLSDLVKVVAAVEGIDEVSVGIFARAAREAGLLTQKGRGRGAAHMSKTDAANLLIAVNGSTLAKEVPHRVPQFRALKLSPRHSGWWSGPDLDELLVANKEFGAQLEYLIEMAKPIRASDSKLSRLIGTMYDKEDLKYAKKRKLDFPLPELRIVFQLPMPTTSIQLWSTGIPIKDRHYPRIPYLERATSEFTLEQDVDEDNTDRTVEVTISQRTLTEVARCIFT